ncbi:MAG: sigma 54-interacting transcriptional regulator [Spirochaetia bacterium]|nr:sigma 54-interacting transcriptional regulator [Spirochaetia bacterium]
MKNRDDCSVLPEKIIENELLGYEKGAFTGALKLVTRGTIFLDEIGNLSPAAQVKLLRKNFDKIQNAD